MVAYYNDNDPHAAAWLRELIAEGLIADGIVDERSIADVQPEELDGYGQCHFFAGIGGWSYALRLAGWPDDRPVWTGSCPCQPFSAAGRGLAKRDPRHLWPAFRALIAERKPSVVFGEQVASKAGYLWLVGVRADLECAGYAVGAADLPAACVGAPHIRQRLFWVADTEGARRKNIQRRARSSAPKWRRQPFASVVDSWPHKWLPKSLRGWRVHGLLASVGTVRGFGQAIVPQVAAEFIGAYLETEGVTCSQP